MCRYLFCDTFGLLAQLVEQRTVNPLVAGSSPAQAARIGVCAEMGRLRRTVNPVPLGMLVRIQHTPPEFRVVSSVGRAPDF